MKRFAMFLILLTVLMMVGACVRPPERSYADRRAEYERLDRMRDQQQFENSVERAIRRSQR